MLCIASMTPSASMYRGLTTFTRRRRRRILTRRRRRTSTSRSLRPSVRELASPFSTVSWIQSVRSHWSKMPKTTMEESIMFQMKSSSALEKKLHPLRRILTKSSKRKKVRMRLLIGSHMGEGTSVSMPMQMMLVMITMETSVVNHSRPVQRRSERSIRPMSFTIRRNRSTRTVKTKGTILRLPVSRCSSGRIHSSSTPKTTIARSSTFHMASELWTKK
mmetsp:Transcript_46193/g.136514  ORF Transcript_46193/g.136514 Transcript_46193/m.136514 type:complete len:218 (-) Transcript_46193:366-1019(-)